MRFTELWKLAADAFQLELNFTNCRFIWTKTARKRGMEQCFGALSDLIRRCDFGPNEESIVRYVFIFNIGNGEIPKQLCMETLAAPDALQFAVVKDREIMCKRGCGGLPKFGRNKFNSGRQNTRGVQQSGYTKREPVEDVKG